MADDVTIGGIIKTSIVSAFTFAVALIWKDVIVDFMEFIFPESNYLFYSFLTAVFATVLVIIAIFLILKAERETEIITGRIIKRNNRNREVNLNENE